MSVKVEKGEKNTAKLIIEVPAEEFEAAIKRAYEKNKDKFQVDGFRKGKVPYDAVEKMYGPSVFFEDAANDCIQKTYPDAAKETELEIVSMPEINVTKIAKGDSLVYEATVALKPDVKLGKYKGIKVDKVEVEVTDDEVDAELDKVKEQNARLVAKEGEPVADGDTVTIDFEGFVDDKPFEGGKGEDYPLVIGSHSFIDTFEEQLIGKNAGDDVDINVTFPEQYQAEELQGKPALFKVKIKEIKVKEYPEIDDDFAQDVSEFDTLDEYKEDIKKNLSEQKEKNAEAEKEGKIIEAIVEDAKMDVPEQMINTAADQMVQEFAQQIQMQGISFDQYMQMTGSSPEAMRDQVKPQAENRVKSSLVLEAIVDAENIEASDEDVEEELKKMADQYQMELDKVKEMIGDQTENLKRDITMQKAVKFVVDESK